MRTQKKYTQEKFAEKIDKTQRQVSFIEIGKCFPAPETLANISNVLNCSMKDLFDFESGEDIEYVKSELNNMIQSYEFKFSVEDEKVAEKLMRCSGRNVELHYKEYKNPIMWRGVSEFVVDSIVAVK